MARRFSRRAHGSVVPHTSAPRDDGTRIVTFSTSGDHSKFVDFMWMRVPDNRRKVSKDDRTVVFMDNPNMQIRRMAQGLNGVWS